MTFTKQQGSCSLYNGFLRVMWSLNGARSNIQCLGAGVKLQLASTRLYGYLAFYTGVHMPNMRFMEFSLFEIFCLQGFYSLTTGQILIPHSSTYGAPKYQF